MSIPIKLICPKAKVRKDGTSLIFIQYCLNSEKRILLNTEIAIPPTFWNRKSQKIIASLPLSFGDYESLTFALQVKIRKAEDIISIASKNKNIINFDIVKQNFYSTEFISNNEAVLISNNLYSEIDSFINDKKKIIKPTSVLSFYEMKRYLIDYENYYKIQLNLNNFNIDFYQNFVYFLKNEIVLKRKRETIIGLRINSIGKIIKRLKEFLKDRMKRKIIPIADLSDFKAIEEDVEKVYLSVAEISKIYHLQFSENEKNLETCRDLFVLGCLTGLRFGDYSSLQLEDLRDGFLYVTQQKTNAQVIIPLRKEALKILVEKYNMNLPAISNSNFNFQIKQVCKLASINEKIKISYKKGSELIEEIKPKYEWVTSHTCRRSFCTNEFLQGTPSDLIMNISGHKTEKTFRKYVKADKHQKAMMLKKEWDKRMEL